VKQLAVADSEVLQIVGDPLTQLFLEPVKAEKIQKVMDMGLITIQ
jgi:hypothetical protein